MEIELNIVVHNYGGSTEEVGVFLTPKETLKYLSHVCHKRFKTVDDFHRWRDKQEPDPLHSTYTWHVHKLVLRVD